MKLFIDVPSQLRPRVEYAWQEFALRLGVALQLEDTIESAHWVYTNSNCSALSGKEVIRCEPEWYFEKKLSATLRQAYQNYLEPGFDCIGLTFRLLTFLDEQEIGENCRDDRGIFYSSVLPEWRQAVAARPLVDECALAFKARYENLLGETETLWPGGKKSALVVTHDTDALQLGSMNELCALVAKWARRRLPVYKDLLWASLKARRAPIIQDPYFCFQNWADLENQFAAKSCFLLSTAAFGTHRTLNDCKSYFHPKTDDALWQPLRTLSQQGWEFGLHAGIEAKKSLDYFIHAKKFLEEKLETPIWGLRHHYWALDWEKPHRTHRKHVNAGFRYDMSIAWRDIPGFRAGTALPYRPYDLEREKPLDMYVFPTCLLEKHVLPTADAKLRGFSDEGIALEAAMHVLKLIQERGLCAVVDWHTETGCNQWLFAGFTDSFLALLQSQLSDPTIFVGTPHELTRHWHRRRMKLTSLGRGQWSKQASSVLSAVGT
jgi:hypothetical protein